MPNHTKIVATIGPASESSQILKKLVNSGVTVFRLNMKHNSYDWYTNVIERIRRIAEEQGINLAIMADLQGPELRTGVFTEGMENIILKKGQNVVLTNEKIPAGDMIIPFAYVDTVLNLHPKHKIFIDDGRIELEVTKVASNYIRAEVLVGDVLGMRKSVSIPEATINIPTLLPKDKKDIKFAIGQGIDFFALSFVREKRDIATLHRKIKRLKGTQHIVAKIETLKAIENFDEILEETNAIMFARGDLGVEIAMERLPKLQKELIKKCREKSKPIIVATQMLESMVIRPTPTRAEVADIANAVFDKTDALMLSEESAVGKYPVKTVTTMSRIARYNERHQFEDDLKHNPNSFEEIIIAASIKFINQKPSGEKGVQGYIIFTESGKSARVLSRFRPPLPIFAFTAHKHTARQLAMSYGVVATKMRLHKNPITNTKNAIELLKRKGLVYKGEKLIVVFGNNVGEPGANNNLSVVEV